MAFAKGLKNLFSPPKLKRPPPPPSTPIKADASLVSGSSDDAITGFSSLISTSSTGLKRKAKTQKTTLLGGT